MAFQGVAYRLADSWFQIVPVEDKPIKYLEIGVFYGANLFSVCDSYAKHKDSKVYGIDPWEDYSEYSEYKNEQNNIYNVFQQNLANRHDKDKIHIQRGYSHNEISKFEDGFFDIIYIDGNHEPEYVLEDAVLAFRKLKIDGYLIFDDYGWGGADLTQRGIDAFASGYHKRMKFLGTHNTQYFMKRMK
jgi:hypothetical protein